MTKLKIGIIGLGITRGYAPRFKDHPNVDICALADLDPAKLEEWGPKLGADRHYSCGEEMIDKEDLDIVLVATPNKFHAPLSIAALEAGCHVFCEKPMAMNADEARTVQDVADRVGKRIMIHYNRRFEPQSHALKKQVDAGVLGDVYYAKTLWLRRRGIPGFGGWFGKKELAGGGPLIDLGVHRLDLALWLMGFPKPVWAMGTVCNPIATRIAKEQGKEFDVEDFAAGSVKFENGAMLTLEASWASNIKERDLMHTQLFGSKGGLVQYNIDEGYNYEAELYVEHEGCQYDMKLHPPVPGMQTPMGHFVESIVNDTPHIATGEEGILTMKILDAIYKSAETGEPVKM